MVASATGAAPEPLRPEVEVEKEVEGMASRPNAEKALKERNVNPTTIGAILDEIQPSVILETCRWYDHEATRRQIGPGVLITQIRAGGSHRFQPALNRSILATQRDYADKITAWLQHHFPDLCREQTPHPAAINAVVRLHHTHGKGTVTAAEHGNFIRAFVEAWDHRYAYSDERNAA